MKTIIKLTFIFLISLSTSCQSDDDGGDPISQLPEATQTGAGTFGCLVNGEPFIDNSGFFNTYYQQVNGEFFFSIGAGSDSNSILRQVRLASEEAEIEEDSTYSLKCNEAGEVYAEVGFPNVLLGNDTCESNFGNLNITRFDLNESIVSGTFEFDIIDPRDNSIIEIREGRFDALFTQ